MVRRLLLGLAIALVAAVPAAATDIAGRKHEVDARIGALQGRISAARQRESALAADIAAATAQIRTLERQVGDVSEQLVVLEHDLALHRERLARLKRLLTFQTTRLAQLRRQYTIARTRFDRRLVAVYERGEVTTLDVVFAASTFRDVLDRLDYSRRIVAQDDRVAEEVGAARDALRDERARTRRTTLAVGSATRILGVRTGQARELRDRLAAQRGALAASRSAKQAAFASTRAEARAAAGEASALADVSARLSAQLRAAAARAAAQRAAAARAAAAPPPPAPSFAPPPSPSPSPPPPAPRVAVVDSTPSSSGLIWPVNGPVTSPFGTRWGRMHTGIDIGVPAGTPIHAAASGLVVFAGWMGGYGNLIIVDHGGGLATAYGHQSGFAVGGGAHVAQGQLIGFVGCTGHCFGPHLHFEVRVGGTPVDPLGYL